MQANDIVFSEARYRYRLEMESVKLFEPDGRTQLPYAALIYCWGNSEVLLTTTQSIQTRKRSIEWLSLPKVFQDAITLTHKLGVNGDAPESYRGQSVDEKSLFCSTMGRCQLSIYTCSRHLSAAICRGCGLHSPISWWLTAEISN